MLRSCNPDHTVVCDWPDWSTNDVNDNELIGALVGGPNQIDMYVDDRKDWNGNGVAVDFNAGFQTALAGSNMRVVIWL